MLRIWIVFCLTTGFAQPLSETRQPELVSVKYENPCSLIDADPVDFVAHSGKWFEIERSENNYDRSEICHSEYWHLPVKNESEVSFKSVRTESNITSSINSRAVQNDRGFVFTHYFPTIGPVITNYYPIGFNSSEYAIVVSCSYSKILAWVFARLPTPPENISTLKQEAFSRYNLQQPKMVRHDHSNCSKKFSSYNFPQLVNNQN